MKRRQLAARCGAREEQKDRTCDAREYVLERFTESRIGITVEDATWPAIPGETHTLGGYIRNETRYTLRCLHDATSKRWFSRRELAARCDAGTDTKNRASDLRYYVIVRGYRDTAGALR